MTLKLIFDFDDLAELAFAEAKRLGHNTENSQCRWAFDGDQDNMEAPIVGIEVELEGTKGGSDE